MSLGGWIRRQLARPIAGREHSTAAVCGLLLLLAAAGLTVTSPSRPGGEGPERARPATGPAAARGDARSRWTPAVSADAKAAAAAFLRGYLAYLYGKAPASDVNDAIGGLIRSLEHARAEVPLGIKRLHPRVVRLDVSSQAPGHAIATALVSDAEVVRYPIRLVLTQGAAGWQVSELGSRP